MPDYTNLGTPLLDCKNLVYTYARLWKSGVQLYSTVKILCTPMHDCGYLGVHLYPTMKIWGSPLLETKLLYIVTAVM